MAVSREETSRIARLLRIEVSEERLGPLSSELTRILDWIEQLREVDIEAVEPMVTPISLKIPFREDIAETTGCNVLANAPEAEDGFFVVPRIIE